MTEVQKVHQHLIVKVRQEKRHKPPCINCKQGSCQRRNSWNYWHDLECAKIACKFGDQRVYNHVAASVDEENNSVTVAIHLLANDERQMQWQKIQSDDKTEFRDSIISPTGMFRKGKHWILHLESSRQDPKISEIQALQQSVKDPSHGPCAWKKWQGNQLWTLHRERVQNSRFVFWESTLSSNRVPRAMLLHLLWEVTEREFIVQITAYHEQKNWHQKSKTRFEN